jgi:hypothetical protein
VQIGATPVMRGTVHPVRNMVVRPRVEEAFGFASAQVLDLPGERRKLHNLTQRSAAKRQADHLQLDQALERITGRAE